MCGIPLPKIYASKVSIVNSKLNIVITFLFALNGHAKWLDPVSTCMKVILFVAGETNQHQYYQEQLIMIMTLRCNTLSSH